MRSKAEKHENENTQKECLLAFLLFSGKKKVKMKKENQERNYEEKC